MLDKIKLILKGNLCGFWHFLTASIFQRRDIFFSSLDRFLPSLLFMCNISPILLNVKQIIRSDTAVSS